MRILWLSPWLRTLSRVHAEGLIHRGHEVLLVTADQHPEPTAPLPYELVLRPRPKDPGTWPAAVAARRRVRAFAPDVVVTELVRDPRWIAFAPGVPRVNLVHDDRPHDATELRPRWERTLFDRWARAAQGTVVFSHYVAEQLSGSGLPRLRVVPLTSDLSDGSAPPSVQTEHRRDFFLVGRIAAYKNVDIVLQAWQAHVSGPGWRGDQLVVVGDGPLPSLSATAVRRRAGGFAYGDLVADLARAKASVVHYRQASQSGVQVLSMQLGVTTIASPEGALPEYQPPGAPVVGIDDVAGLRAAFDQLADPVRAQREGQLARDHYSGRFTAAHAAAAIEDVLSDAVSSRREGPHGRRPSRPPRAPRTTG